MTPSPVGDGSNPVGENVFEHYERCLTLDFPCAALEEGIILSTTAAVGIGSSWVRCGTERAEYMVES